MNNPYVDRLIKKTRLKYADACIPKGKSGARDLVRAVRAGKCIGMLTDQKMNDGISVDFMGRPAMTAPAIAQMALKYNCALIPMRAVRIGACRFRCEIFPPMEIGEDKETHANEGAIVAAVNQIYEKWIREYPEQWFWLHRRWPDSP